MYPVLWRIYFPCIYLVDCTRDARSHTMDFSTYDRQLFAVERSALSGKGATAAQKRARTALGAQKSWKRPSSASTSSRLSDDTPVVVVTPSKGVSLSLYARIAHQIFKKHILAAWVMPTVSSWPDRSPAWFSAIIAVAYALKLLNAGPSLTTFIILLLPTSQAIALNWDRLRALAEEIRATSWIQFVRDVSQSCPPQGWIRDLTVVARDATRVSIAFRAPKPQQFCRARMRFGMPVTSFIIEAQSDFSDGAWKQLRGAHGSALRLDLDHHSGNISRQTASFLLYAFRPSHLSTLVYAPKTWFLFRRMFLACPSICFACACTCLDRQVL